MTVMTQDVTRILERLRSETEAASRTEAADMIEALHQQLADAQAARDAWRGQIGTIAALVPIPEVVKATGSIADLVAWLTETVHDRDALAAKLAAAEARAGALEQERVAEWNRRREADGSRDAAFAACDAMRDEHDALAGTLKYLRIQAKNGTLHPQVVIQNVDAALTTPAEETKG